MLVFIFTDHLVVAEENTLKQDKEVQLYLRERQRGATQLIATARSGMCVRTARKYERAKTLPSQLKKTRTHLMRPNPFALDWDWIVSELTRDPALHAITLFALLCEKNPTRYKPIQVRTLQRHIATWRALHGAEKEVIFSQIHQPAKMAQSDFTHIEDLAITIAKLPAPPMLFHLVLTYSNVEAVSVCQSETFEALAEGIEAALWQIGGVPQQHRTDHLSAALRHLNKEGREDFTERYAALMRHYGMQATTNNLGVSHENGDVEQSHFRFKDALDQTLRVRGSRDFLDLAEYERFLQDLVKKRNATRSVRFTTEKPLLKPLPAKPLEPSRELRVKVSQFSTIQVLGNTYSVPSRLIGSQLKLVIHSREISAYVGTKLALSLPRLAGSHKHLINYRHVIWSLVKNPHAFEGYRYRDEFFPSLTFRQAYDLLATHLPTAKCDGYYLQILHLAASTSEVEVETALSLLLEAGNLPTFKAVQDLVQHSQPRLSTVLQLEPPAPRTKFAQYDQLLSSVSSIKPKLPTGIATKPKGLNTLTTTAISESTRLRQHA
jgi:hypothetical protein